MSIPQHNTEVLLDAVEATGASAAAAGTSDPTAHTFTINIQTTATVAIQECTADPATAAATDWITVATYTSSDVHRINAATPWGYRANVTAWTSGGVTVKHAWYGEN